MFIDDVDIDHRTECMSISHFISSKSFLRHALLCYLLVCAEDIGNDWDYFKFHPDRDVRLIEEGENEYNLAMMVIAVPPHL